MRSTISILFALLLGISSVVMFRFYYTTGTGEFVISGTMLLIAATVIALLSVRQ